MAPDTNQPTLRANCARRPYEPIVRRLHPAAAGEEIHLHCSILLLRDLATWSIGRCSEQACLIHYEIVWLASQHAFNPLPVSDLRSLRAELVRLQLAAVNLQPDGAVPRHDPKAG